MAISIDEATKVISVGQSDLTLVSGTLYELDTNAFRIAVKALLASERYIWMPVAIAHNGEVTVAGTTFARAIELINGYSITFENLSYSVRLAGSNNNLFDIDGGILNPSALVTVIAQNSAGLISSPDITVIRKLIQNEQYTNPVTNKMEVQNDTSTGIEFEADVWEDDGTTAWDGTGPIVRRDRLDAV
jgi:hypothetical protein